MDKGITLVIGYKGRIYGVVFKGLDNPCDYYCLGRPCSAKGHMYDLSDRKHKHYFKEIEDA